MKVTGARVATFVDERHRSLRILLAEDNESLRRLVTIYLRADGHEVVEARDGVELLQGLAVSLTGGIETAFDAIVSEQTLPGADGLMVLAGLRARGHTIQFVLITEDPDVEVIARALRGIPLRPSFEAAEIRAALAVADRGDLAGGEEQSDAK
jgi:two-component system response regulator (stage 0 sporulation protein F)